MATRVGMKQTPKPVSAPAPVAPVEEPETIAPEVVKELKKALKTAKRGKKKTEA